MNKTLKFGGASALIVLALAWLAYTGVREAKVYYSTISDLHKMDDSVYTKHLRVSGVVQPGSIHAAGTGADFVMVEKGQTLKVSYKGSEPPPDTFKDNSKALAIGTMGRDGVFHASELQAQCASKYEAQADDGAQSSPPPPQSMKN